MTSTFNDVRAVIEKRIADEMTNYPIYPVAYANTAFTPPNDSPWLDVQINFGDNNYFTLQAPTVGTNRQSGVLVIDIFSQVGVGTSESYEIAERMKDLFDRQHLKGIIFDAASGPDQVFSRLSDSYFQVQVSISFDAYLS